MIDGLPVKSIKETELDTAIKSVSANGLVKTRQPYTKIRKQFELTLPSYITEDEFNVLYNLWKAVRTVSTFVVTHPTRQENGVNVQYTVRFAEAIQFSQDASHNNYYEVETIKLEEV